MAFQHEYKLSRDTYPEIVIAPGGTYINDVKISPQKVVVKLWGGACVPISDLVEVYLEHNNEDQFTQTEMSKRDAVKTVQGFRRPD